jgi:hypothetical protein
MAKSSIWGGDWPNANEKASILPRGLFVVPQTACDDCAEWLAGRSLEIGIDASVSLCASVLARP